MASNVLYVLRRDKLTIEEKGTLKLTDAGKKLLDKLKIRRSQSLPPKNYGRQNDGILKIIAFDVPEKEARKRHWLRSVLKNLGYKMLQKSVWVGKKNIPPDLIKDLERLRILDCVEIIAVTKAGTLRHLV